MESGRVKKEKSSYFNAWDREMRIKAYSVLFIFRIVEVRQAMHYFRS